MFVSPFKRVEGRDAKIVGWGVLKGLKQRVRYLFFFSDLEIFFWIINSVMLLHRSPG